MSGYGINLSARVASNVSMTIRDSSFLHLLVIPARGYLGRDSPCLQYLVERVHGERQNAGYVADGFLLATFSHTVSIVQII